MKMSHVLKYVQYYRALIKIRKRRQWPPLNAPALDIVFLSLSEFVSWQDSIQKCYLTLILYNQNLNMTKQICKEKSTKKKPLPPSRSQNGMEEAVRPPEAALRESPIADISTAVILTQSIGGLSGVCLNYNQFLFLNNPAGRSPALYEIEEEEIEEREEEREEERLDQIVQQLDGFDFDSKEGEFYFENLPSSCELPNQYLDEGGMNVESSEDALHHFEDDINANGANPEYNDAHNALDQDAAGNEENESANEVPAEYPSPKRKNKDNIRFKRLNVIGRNIMKILTNRRHKTQWAIKNSTNKCYFVGMMIYIDQANQLDNLEELFNGLAAKLRNKLRIERNKPRADQNHLIEIERLIEIYAKAVKEFMINRNPLQALKTVYLYDPVNRKQNIKGFQIGTERIQELITELSYQ